MTTFKDQWLVKPLIKSGLVAADAISRLSTKDESDTYLSEQVISSGLVSESTLGKLLEKLFQIPFVDLTRVKLYARLMEIIPEESCRKYHFLAYKLDDTYITIAIYDPLNLDAEREASFLCGRLVKTTLASKRQIEEKINEFYSPDRYIEDLSEKLALGDVSEDLKMEEAVEKIDGSSDAPIVRLISSILNDAIDKSASDIHFEPAEQKVIIRFRIDGILKKVMDVPKYAAPQLIARIKVISSLDIAETRKPQDGQARIKRRGTHVDLRVSILPTNYGEKAVIRILDSSRGAVPFEQLGITGPNLEKLQQVLALRQGIILATGPTGSGKTTTLYSALNKIKSPSTNILTVEDPIEYSIEGINQVQVNAKAGITFASALRSFLRQDPDVILVGEVRDKETAEISIQAALTGHLVLSTVHTNNAVETITRLIDLGIDRYKVSAAISAVIAQRLVRRICSKCKVETEVEAGVRSLVPLIKQLGLPVRFYKGDGCAECDFTGYKGRVGIYEILIVDKELRFTIDENAPMAELEQVAIKNGFQNFTSSALNLITSGVSDHTEIARVINLAADADAAQAQEKPAVVPEFVPQAVYVPSPAADSESESRKILLVDDDPLIRRMVLSILNKNGYDQVREATDGQEAVDMVQAELPDLILLDIMMPKLNGYEVCKFLRENPRFQNIPIIMMTALGEKEDLLKAFEMGVDDYLSKPIDRQILLARIEALFRRIAVGV